MITIREIASIAGVSRSTVSLVLNNSPLVKPETRERVLKIIRETGYVPNSNARNLNWRSTRCLGIVVISDQQRSTSYDFSTPVGLFSLNVMRGITSRLADSDYSVIIEYYAFEDQALATDGGGIHPPESLMLPKLIRERKVDGAFLVGGFCTASLLNGCLATGIPLITVGVGADTPLCDAVISDPCEGTYTALKRLYDQGRRHLGLVNCPHSFRSAAPRLEGMKRFCRDMGLPFREENVIFGQHNNGQSAYEAIQAAWQMGQRFDGLVAANPQSALGAMRFLSEQNVRIPQDLSIIAYEDNALCGYAIPPLTAINIQKEKMGAEAASLMLQRLADPQMDSQLRVVPSYLVERGSV